MALTLRAVVLVLVLIAAPTATPAALLSADKPPLAEDDCGLGRDASATVAEVLPAEGCRGSLVAHLDAGDLFLPAASAGKRFVRVQADAGTELLACTGYRLSGRYLEIDCLVSRGDVVLLTLSPSSLLQEVLLRPFEGPVGGYAVRSTDEDDCGLGQDADASAPALVPAGTRGCAGRVDATDVDAYLVDVPDGMRFQARLVHEAGPEVLLLLCTERPDGGDRECVEEVEPSVVRPEGGRWLVSIAAVESVPYRAELIALRDGPEPAQDDCGSGGDAPGEAPGAEVALPVSCSGSFPVSAWDWVDTLSFEIPAAGGSIEAELVSIPLGGRVCILRPDGFFATCGTVAVAPVVTPGTWSLRVQIFDGAGDWSLRVRHVVAHDDCGLGVDAGDASAPLAPTEHVACAAALVGEDVDAFARSFAVGEELTLAFEPAVDGNVGACLRRPNGAILDCASHAMRWNFAVDAPGVWTLVVQGVFGRAGAYSVTFGGPPVQSDCGLGIDVASHVAGGRGLSLPLGPRQCAGVLAGKDTADAYRVFVPSGTAALVVRLEPAADAGDLDVCVHLVEARACSRASEGAEHLVVLTPQAQAVVEVFAHEGAGAYVLTLERVPL